MQDNAEVGAAYTLHTPDLELGAAGVNFATGVGLSYALGTPSYEDGPLNDPARRYRLQLLLLFDLEWKLRGYGDWSLVTRVHHRSGVYGLIAPHMWARTFWRWAFVINFNRDEKKISDSWRPFIIQW